MNIVHRDLKPQNILMKEGSLKLADFGLSRHIERELAFTAVGSPYYMSPQVLQNSVEGYTAKTDVWSAGVILYSMLLHRLPFQGNNRRELLEVIRSRTQKQRGRLQLVKEDQILFQIQHPKVMGLVKWMLNFSQCERASWQQVYLSPVLQPYIQPASLYSSPILIVGPEKHRITQSVIESSTCSLDIQPLRYAKRVCKAFYLYIKANNGRTCVRQNFYLNYALLFMTVNCWRDQLALLAVEHTDPAHAFTLQRLEKQVLNFRQPLRKFIEQNASFFDTYCHQVLVEQPREIVKVLQGIRGVDSFDQEYLRCLLRLSRLPFELKNWQQGEKRRNQCEQLDRQHLLNEFQSVKLLLVM